MNITDRLKSITPKYCQEFPALAWGDIQEATRVIEELLRQNLALREIMADMRQDKN